MATLRSPTWLLDDVDFRTATVRLLEIDRRTYSESSWLDTRMTPEPRQSANLPLLDFVRAMEDVPDKSVHWIFHVSHCGSTLLTRLVEGLPSTHVLREPAVLRGLADTKRASVSHRLPTHWRRALRAARSSFGRTYADADSAFVKPTSVTANLLGDLIDPDGGDAVTILTNSAREHASKLLAGPAPFYSLVYLPRFRRDLMLAGYTELANASTASLGEEVALMWLSRLVLLRRGCADAGIEASIVKSSSLLEQPQRVTTELAARAGTRPSAAAVEAACGPEVVAADSKRRPPEDLVAPRNDVSVAAEVLRAMTFVERAMPSDVSDIFEWEVDGR